MHVRTPFQASSVRFSPYVEGRIAVGTAQNFGIIGNGKQHVYQASACLHCACMCCFSTRSQVDYAPAHPKISHAAWTSGACAAGRV